MNIYDIAIAPGGVHTINVQADYIYFLKGTAGGADTTIVFQPSAGGESVYLQPGQAYKMPAAMRGKNVTWVLRNLKGEGRIAGVILMGEGEFQDNRVSGSVEVIDGGKARTMANMAFTASAAVGSDATTGPAIYLQNPAGSGRVIVVKSFNISVEAALTYGLCWVDGVTGGEQSAEAIVSKSQAGAFAAKIFRHSTGTQKVGLKNSFAMGSLAANGSAMTVFQEPIVLRPGMQLMAFATTGPGTILTTWECIEEVL